MSASPLRLAGVAGQPIAHSLSPLIHGAWIRAAGLDGRYEAFGPTDADGFAALIQQGRAGALVGLNVTAPFKEQALALADEASETARRAGSANLLRFEAGRLSADSTDGEGVLAALSEQAPDFDLAAGPALVLGAGGAARAAIAALVDAGAPEVVVWNRTLARAEALAADLGGPVRAGGSAGDARLIINAISGAGGHDFAATPDARVALDMTYRPLMTPFLRSAETAGLTPVDGLAMLIGQARPSFHALFGVAPPDVDVRALALQALEAAA